MQTSGLDLKLERVAARIPAGVLARALGVSAGRVTHIEAYAVVTPTMVVRYHDALDKCRTQRTTAA